MKYASYNYNIYFLMISYLSKILLVLLILPVLQASRPQEVLQLDLESTDYLVVDANDFANPVYDIEPLPLPEFKMRPAGFCNIEQPRFDLQHLEKEWDQTNPLTFEEEDQLLMVNDNLHVLLSDGRFQVFNVTFMENEANIKLNHYNEIRFADHNLIKALNGPFFLKLLYNQEFGQILIVTSESIFVVNVDIDNKAKWLKYFQVNSTSDEKILRATMNGNFLYVLRKNNQFEKYELISGTSLMKEHSFSFSNLPIFSKRTAIEISDFFINNKYLAFVEKNNKTLYLSTIYGNIKEITSQKTRVFPLKYPPSRVFSTNSKVFVLLEGQYEIEYFLHEYLILEDENLEYIDTYHIDWDFSDLYITDNYLFYSYKGYTTMVPHAFVAPDDLNRRLKVTINLSHIREIQPFALSNDALVSQAEIKSNYFSAAVGRQIGVFKVSFIQGKLICKTQNTELGNYYLKLRYYQVRCRDIERNCNTSDYFYKDQLIKVLVTPAGQVTLFSGTEAHKQGLLFGLLLGGVVVIIILLLCFLYVRKIKNSYIRYEENREENKQFGTKRTGQMRVMSKEELDTIEINKKNDLSMRNL